MKRFLLSMVAGSCLLSINPVLAMIASSDHNVLQFLSIDKSSESLSKSLVKEREFAFANLKQELGGIQVKLDWQKNGSFAFMRNASIGNALIKGFALGSDAKSAEDASRAFLKNYKGLFGISDNDLKNFVIDKNEVIGSTKYAKGVHYVSFVQIVDGVKVHKARITFAIHSVTGDLYAVTSNVFSAPKNSSSFKLNTDSAVQKLLKAVNIEGSLKSIKNHKLGFEATVTSKGLDDNRIVLNKTFLTKSAGKIVPGYVAWLWTKSRGLLEVGIDATTGDLLLNVPLTSNYSYNMGAWSGYPLNEDGSLATPSLLTKTHDLLASPYGWASQPGSDGLYRTIGPNVVTFYDWNGTFSGYSFEEAMRPYTAAATSVSGSGYSSVISFDYLSQWENNTGPQSFVQLSMVQNFTALNELHDHYFDLGFTKTQGNFQDEDPVLVNAQDSVTAETPKYNNANFATPPDGISGRMNMYLFNDTTGALKDGTIDRIVFTHELGHGLSHRLVNFGDNTLYGQQSGAFGEGQADVFAFLRENTKTSSPETFALSPYIAWEYFMYGMRGSRSKMLTGPFANDIEKPMGRFTAYSYEVGDEYDIEDPSAQRTFKHWGLLPIAVIGETASGNPKTGFSGDWTYYVYPETHSDGEIWASALWRAKLRVEETVWADPDRMLGFEQTMLMGMQMMPANPNFVQSRDAFLIYENMTQDEPATCMMKYEFARTGLGTAATAGNDGSAGTADTYDSETGSYKDMKPDFNEWGCARGTYTSEGDGDVSMIFKASSMPEVELTNPLNMEIIASTPGYLTRATLSGDSFETTQYYSLTDYMDKVVEVTPTAIGVYNYTAVVTSNAGASESQTLSFEVVQPAIIPSSTYSVTDYVELGDNEHYKMWVDHASYTTGQSLQFRLKSTDDVDIDLYGNFNTLALPQSYAVLDADADGDETLTFTRTDTGWSVLNGTDTVIANISSTEAFYFYLDIAGFTASNYKFNVSLISAKK